MTNAVDEFLGWATDAFPDAHWLPGASEEALAGVEGTLGRRLPPELRELYLRHDGQPETATTRGSVFESFRFLSLREALDSWRECLRLDAEVAQEYPEAANSFRREWFPFAWDIDGSHWCVDLDSGEVFELYESFELGRTLGPSFDDFLKSYVLSFQTGDRVVDAKRGARRKPEPELPRAAQPVVPPSRKRLVLGLLVLYAVAFAALMLWLARRH